MKIKLSPWTMVNEYCAMRYIEGTDSNDIANRVAFIEKSARVRVNPYDYNQDLIYDCYNWYSGFRGHSPEYGEYQPSRDWCDSELIKMGYELG
jgi:hypothetical protein